MWCSMACEYSPQSPVFSIADYMLGSTSLATAARVNKAPLRPAATAAYRYMGYLVGLQMQFMGDASFFYILHVYLSVAFRY